MNTYKIGLACILLLCCLQNGFAQHYKPGDKLEAFINNTWKPVTVIKSVPGKPNAYQVQEINTKASRGASVGLTTINNTNLRSQKPTAVVNAITNAKTVTGSTVASVHLGRYELYAGVPSMYIGHFILLANGRYKVAFNTDEENYDERGSYTFHAETNSIEWLGGMFKSNNWGGKLIKKDDTAFRIEFTPTTFADSK